MRIAMIGTGYVGLVSGACFADFGHQVCCIDKDEAKIDGLNAGKMPIWEPGLEALVKANAERGRLTFTKDLSEGVKGAKVMAPGTVVVTKSTVPVGTGDEIEKILREEGITDASVASNPEFLREGAAI